MMDYARSDTHYLLYVYDKMRNALHEKSNPETLNILRQSLKSSEQTSLKLYVKDLYSPEGDGANGWRLALGKCGVPLLPEQAAVFKAMHQWVCFSMISY
jgi:exosome complex exonuclease RRP6